MGAGGAPAAGAGVSVAGLVGLAVMALATGVRKGPEDLADYADTLTQPQLRALNFRRDQRTGWHRCPKKTTFTRLLAGVDAGALERILLAWQQRLTGPIQDNLVIVDGKKMRHGGGEMVNATDGQGQYLGASSPKPRAMRFPPPGKCSARLELGGKIVLSDALHTQVETAQLILFEQGGDYLMTVKANQPTLQTTLQNLFEKQLFPPSGPPPHPGRQTGAQSGSLGNPGPAVLGSDAEPGRLSGSQTGGAIRDPG